MYSKRAVVMMFGVISISAILVLLSRSLWSSFWVDETITFWVAKDSLHDAYSRSVSFQNHTFLYFSYIWAIQKLLPHSEAILRSTNIPFGIATLGCMFLFFKNVGGARFGLLALIFFSFSQPFYFALQSYRPYIFCLFFFSLSLCCLVIPHRTSRHVFFSGLGWGVVLALNLVYVFSAPLMVFFLLYNTRREWQSSFIKFALGCGLGLVVAVPNILATLERKNVLIHMPDSRFVDLLGRTMESQTALLFIFALMVVMPSALILNTKTTYEAINKSDTNRVVLYLGLLAIAPVTLFIAERNFQLNVNTERYWLWTIIPQSLLAAWILMPFLQGRFYFVKLSGILVIAVISSYALVFIEMDYKTAIAELSRIQRNNPECTIYFQSALVESNYPEYYATEESRAYLNTPISFYPWNGPNILLTQHTYLQTHPPRNCSILFGFEKSFSVQRGGQEITVINSINRIRDTFDQSCIVHLQTGVFQIWRCKSF